MVCLGFTVVELLVSVTVILIVLALSGSGYLKMLKGFRVQAAFPEDQMSQLTGLELLRYDVEMAGYGLPWSVVGVVYNEADNSSGNPSPSSFNDAPDKAPRAVVHDNNTGIGNSDVLVLKSAIAHINETTRKWSMLYYDSHTWKVKQWDSEALSLKTDERFTIMDTSKKLIQDNSTKAWFLAYKDSYKDNASSLPSPSDNSSIYLLYGVNPSEDLRMPFNRVDYYLSNSGLSSKCDPSSFVLYRATVNHSDGKRRPQAILDCVRDFQVAFGLDTNGDGVVDEWRQSLNIMDTNGNGTADELRKQLREIRIFLLVQDGIRDADYSFQSSIILGDNNTGTLSTYTPSGDSRHYRWKVLKLTVKPMNLR